MLDHTAHLTTKQNKPLYQLTPLDVWVRDMVYDYPGITVDKLAAIARLPLEKMRRSVTILYRQGLFTRKPIGAKTWKAYAYYRGSFFPEYTFWIMTGDHHRTFYLLREYNGLSPKGVAQWFAWSYEHALQICLDLWKARYLARQRVQFKSHWYYEYHHCEVYS